MKIAVIVTGNVQSVNQGYSYYFILVSQKKKKKNEWFVYANISYCPSENPFQTQKIHGLKI